MPIICGSSVISVKSDFLRTTLELFGHLLSKSELNSCVKMAMSYKLSGICLDTLRSNKNDMLSATITSWTTFKFGSTYKNTMLICSQDNYHGLCILLS